MSILKDSLKTALFSKPMAILVVMILLFLGAVGYFIGYLATYKETIVSTTPVELNIIKVMKQNVDGKYNVYYRYKDNETTYAIKLSSCVIKPKLDGTVVKAENIQYTYSTVFNDGSESRLSKPSQIFCVQK